MRVAGVAIFAALLALAGCKNADKDKSGGARPPAGVAGRTKKDGKGKDDAVAKGPSWLEGVDRLPGTGTAIPRGRNGGDPADPNFDAKAAAQDALGGRILDPDGKPARNIFVRIDRVGAAGAPAGLGIYTKDDGYFFATGFKAGQAYELTARATTTDGRQLVGTVQTKVPNPILTIVLRDDSAPKLREPDASFPPEPKPSDKVGDAAPRPADGGWGPGAPATGKPPATIGGGSPAAPATGGALPEPDDLAPGKPLKPENVAEGQRDPLRPIPANIPGGPTVPTLPPLPPRITPPPGGRSSMGTPTGNPAGRLTLLDTLERPWELDAVRPGSLVLVEFISSACVPCKRSIPILRDLQGRYGSGGLRVAAVLCDDLPTRQRAAAAAKYARDNGLNYQVFVEPGDAGSVYSARFGVDRVPYAVLLDASGRVLWRGHPFERDKLEAAIKLGLGK
jgi:thiol-disulfide isomerase/thioredoxin